MKSLFLVLLLVIPLQASVEFDGTDDSITLPDLGAGFGSELTYAMWVKQSTNTGLRMSIILGASGNTDPGAYLRFSSSNVFYFVVGNGTSRDTDTITTSGRVVDTWYHIAASVDLGSAQVKKIYVNGVLEGTNAVTIGGTMAGTQVIHKIGFYSSDAFAGKISEIQIYNRAISASEVSILAASRTKGPKFSGLIHYWPLDDVAEGASADGATFKDRVGTADATGDNGANNTGLTGRAEDYLSYP